jgi:Zn-dependent peptidase ImmA (M78 family)
MANVRAAQEAARSLTKSYCKNLAAIPVEQIARERGVKVQSVPLDDELSGMAFVKGGTAVIVVNAAHHPNRRRFTIAHELGHHVLHQTYLCDNVHVDKAILRRVELSSDGSDAKEVQANAFAAELLMPECMMRRWSEIDINDETALNSVAKKLGVSPAALTYRFINLGIAE